MSTQFMKALLLLSKYLQCTGCDAFNITSSISYSLFQTHITHQYKELVGDITSTHRVSKDKRKAAFTGKNYIRELDILVIDVKKIIDQTPQH